MWYVYLFIGLIILAIIYYYIFKKDVLSVSFISCLVFALSTLAAFIAYKLGGFWNYVELHEKTVMYVIIAMVCVGIGEYLIRIFYKNKKNEQNEIKLIEITHFKILICIVFLLITFLLIYFDMSKITNTKVISEMINIYKTNSAMYNDSDNIEQINFVYTQMYRVSTVIGIIFLYIYVNNMCFNHKLKYNFRFIPPIIISMFLSIFLGGRSSIMRFIVAAFIFFMIIYNKKKKIRLKKFITITILILIIVLPIFYILLGAIGQTTQTSFVNYITFYLGSPIPSFDEYLETSLANEALSEQFGEHTFIGIQQILYKLNVIDYYNVYQSEWIDFGNGLKCNVFTGIKTYFQDFGLGGVIIFQILFGMIYTYLYLKGKNINYKYLIFYGLIGITLIDQFRSEKIFNVLVRIDTIVYIVSIFVITMFLFNIRVKK